MGEYEEVEGKMVAVRLTCDDGAFICNVTESDVVRIASKQSGIFVVMHCAIRLDAMFGGLYEIHRMKSVETSSIDFCKPFMKGRRE